MNSEAEQKLVLDPSPRRDRLDSLVDVRREMGRVYRQMRSGKVKPSDGTRLAYVLSMIGKLIESSELQTRLEALEAAMAARR